MAWKLAIKSAFGFPENALNRIEDMAAHYIAEIQKVNPNGPPELTHFEHSFSEKITPYTGELYLFRAKEQRFFIADQKFLG